MPHSVHRIGRSEVGEVRPERHFQIDNLDFGLARRVEDARDRRDRPLDSRDVDSGAIDMPPFAPKSFCMSAAKEPFKTPIRRLSAYADMDDRALDGGAYSGWSWTTGFRISW
ncbi:MAG TPA: hypothetical protein VJA26_04760 [Gammaproteobacteria bacterium]|nr:hypothetical protein [Gammaproteobacteria bacterium]